MNDSKEHPSYFLTPDDRSRIELESFLLKEHNKTIKRLTELFTECPAPVMRISTDGKLRYSNPASKPVLDKWDSEEMVPKEIKQVVEGALQSKRTQECEFNGADDRIYWLTCIPIVEDGCINIYGSDITERRRAEDQLRKAKEELELRVHERTRDLEKREAKYRAMFELAAVGMGQADPNAGRITEINEKFCELTGYSREELLHMSMWQLTYLADQEKDQALYDQLMTGKRDVYHNEKRYVRKDGRIIWVDVMAKLGPPIAAEPLRTVAIIQDITERKLAEEALRKSADELRKSNAELEQFAFIASHDLQEPLRGISTHLQVVERNIKGRLDEDTREFMQFAIDGALRMKSLIEDLLSYSRVGKEKIDSAIVNLNEALAEATTNLRSVIDENGAQIHAEDLPSIDADLPQMVQLFQNLLGNALKYRNECKPKIHIACEERDSEWKISVRDNGIGISPEYAEKIFVVFQRLHSDRARYPGTGIGLAICKKIVERHRGRIWVESYLGEGSTFYFTIPRR